MGMVCVNKMKTVVVTGATSGIGLAVCEGLVRAGCRVIGVGRSAAAIDKALAALRAAVPEGDVHFVCADLLERAQVLRAADEIRSFLDEATGGELDALVNNVGCVRGWYMTTPDGVEQQFALNHLAGFLLTHALMDCLVCAHGLVLMTSSGSHRYFDINWDDVMFERRYRPLMAYKQSKLCNLLFAQALNDRYGRTGVRAAAVDPGLVNTDIGSKDTGGIVEAFWRMRSRSGTDPSVPAEIYVKLITGGDIDGLYHGQLGRQRHSRHVTKHNADRLFALSEHLCGVRFGGEEA